MEVFRNMKKLVSLLLALTCSACMGICFAACEENDQTAQQPQHKHAYEADWSYDETFHWHRAVCEHADEIIEKAVHSFGDDNICDICNYRTTTIEDPPEFEDPSETHQHKLVKHAAKEPTETQNGNYEYWVCSICGLYFRDADGKLEAGSADIVIPAKQHEHQLIRHEAKEPTCTENGNLLYFECETCHALFLDEENPEQTIPSHVITEATGHTANEEWESDGLSHYHTCEVCGDKIPESAEPHIYGSEWGKNSLSHWKNCEICGNRDGEAEHTFGEDNFCEVCDFEKRTPSTGFEYQLNADNASYTLVGIGECQESDIVIPSTYKGLPVISIKDGALQGVDYLLSVEISEGVKEINSGAFSNCEKLKSVTLPSTITFIGGCTFDGCENFSEVDIFDLSAWCKIHFENYNANPLFYAHHLFLDGEEIEQLTIPKNITEIQEYAFVGCTSLKKVTVSNNVTKIGRDAFTGCEALTSITLPFIGASKDNPENFPFNFIFLLESEGYSVPQSLKEVVITGGTYVAASSFENYNQIEHITISENTTEIGAFAFSGCSSLKSFTIPKSVKKIGNSAFAECVALTSITISEGATSIGSYAFSDCHSLPSVTIPETVTSIEEGAFADCRLFTTVTVPKSVTSMGSGVFRDCTKIEEITLPFVGCNENSRLGSVFSITTQDPEGGNYIEEIVPESLRRVTILGGTTIEMFAFYSCEKVTNVTLGKSIKELKERSFQNCINLKTLTFEKDSQLTKIEAFAFENCPMLEAIEIPANVNSVVSDSFYECTGIGKISVVEGNKNYRCENDCLIENGTNILVLGCVNGEIPEGVVEISNRAFFGRGLKSLRISKSVKKIGVGVFNDCFNLESITVTDGNSEFRGEGNCLIQGHRVLVGCNGSNLIPKDITAIADYAFADCSKIKKMEIPESVTEIGLNIFQGCTGLESMNIPKNIRFMQGTFTNCTSLKNVTFEEGVENIMSTFSGCTALESIALPKSLVYISNHAFEGCTALKSVTIQEGTKYICGNAFCGCTKLTSINIPESVKKIEARAFADCTSLTKITLGCNYGWQVSESENMANANALDAMDPSTAAQYLTSDYVSYYWKCIVS